MNSKTTFKVNGKEYRSVEEMPPDVRTLYEERLAKRVLLPQPRTAPGPTVVMNGKRYRSEHELPPELKALYRRMKGALSEDGNGLLDFLGEGGILDSAVSSYGTPVRTNNAANEELAEKLQHLRTIIACLLVTLSGLLALFLLRG